MRGSLKRDGKGGKISVKLFHCSSLLFNDFSIQVPMQHRIKHGFVVHEVTLFEI